jgi:hypothetical protein
VTLKSGDVFSNVGHSDNNFMFDNRHRRTHLEVGCEKGEFIELINNRKKSVLDVMVGISIILWGSFASQVLLL